MLLSSSDKQNRSTNPIQVAPGPYRHWYWPPLGALDWEAQGSKITKDKCQRESNPSGGQPHAWQPQQLLLTYANVASKSADDTSVGRMPSEEHLDRSTS